MGSGAQAAGPDLSAGIQLSDIPDSQPLSGRVGDETVMLVRLDGEIVALDAACTHYGADLAGGLVDGETVRCPLHHACFSLRTGRALAAPAFEPLGRWTVEVREDRAFVTGRKPAVEQVRPTPADVSNVVIVGGGAAGFACADRLRRIGFAGGITILSADSDPPCDRPNLSKDFLAGAAPAEWIPLRPPEWYDQQQISLQLSTEVVAIDTEARKVRARDGRAFAYDRLLLAPGCEPIRLSGPGFDRPDFMYLRSLADAKELVAHAREGSRAVVLGSGFIGLEAAASLRARGVDVTIVTEAGLPFGALLGADLGQWFRDLHERNGVRLRCSRVVCAFDGEKVRLDDGESIPADFVLAGVGVRPRTAIAEAAGLALGNGILVNAQLETSVPGIFAAGDAAAYPDPVTGESTRIEHWVVAERQGQTVAENMLGAGKPYRDVPFFWTEQYGTALRYVGHARRWDRVEIDGDVGAGRFTARYFQGGTFLASASVDRDRACLEDERRLRDAIDATTPLDRDPIASEVPNGVS